MKAGEYTLPFGERITAFGWLEGQRLYRLAKAIVRHWEADDGD